MASLPDIPVDSALARLFRQPRARAETIWFSLPGGSKLFGQGDPSDQLFIVRTGRLGAFRREEGQESQFLGIIRPGEPAGEMALIAGIPHSADLVTDAGGHSWEYFDAMAAPMLGFVVKGLDAESRRLM